MTYKCCLCGTEYSTSAAAVKCVNRCGRAAHKVGIFETKESNYRGETVEVIYDFEPESNDQELKIKCSMMLDELKNITQKGVFNSFLFQFNQWDKMNETQKHQLYDMIAMYVKE